MGVDINGARATTGMSGITYQSHMTHERYLCRDNGRGRKNFLTGTGKVTDGVDCLGRAQSNGISTETIGAVLKPCQSVTVRITRVHADRRSHSRQGSSVNGESIGIVEVIERAAIVRPSAICLHGSRRASG